VVGPPSGRKPVIQLALNLGTEKHQTMLLFCYCNNWTAYVVAFNEV